MRKLFDKIMGAMGMLEYEEDDYGIGEKTDKYNKYGKYNKSTDTDDMIGRDEPMGFGFNTNTDESGIKTFNNSNPKIVNIHNNSQIKMVLVTPQSYEEARDVCDYIRARKPVVVNLENMDHQIAQRIMDFLSGSCYSLNGDIKRVTKNIFVLAPDNVDVSSETANEFSSDKPNTLPWMRVTK